MSEETQELLTRIAELQQEKWALEERVECVCVSVCVCKFTFAWSSYILSTTSLYQVNHLETTGSALAEDVMQKSEIIKSYFMDTKAGKAHCYVTVSTT